MNLAEAIAQADVTYPVCAGVLVVSASYRGWQLRRDPANYPLRVLCAHLTVTAFAFTCAVPALYVRIGAVSGVGNLATLFVYGFIMLSVITDNVMLAYWHYPPQRARFEARVRMAVTAGVLIAMTALFLASPADNDPEHPVDFDIHYARTPFVAAFLLLYLVTFFWTLIDLARLTTLFARAAGRPLLRRGLRMVATGAVIATGYNVIKIATTVGSWFGPRTAPALVPWNVQVAPAFASMGAMFIVIGWTLPAWRSRNSSLIARYRTYRRLYPLWLALYEANPKIALHPPSSHLRDWWTAMRDITFRLYRQVIEIGDGRLALHAYMDPAVAVDARQAAEKAGLRGDDLDAVVEASVLAAALVAQAHHHPTHAVDDHNDGPVGRGDSLADETAWLCQVARAFSTSPIVSAIRHQAETRAGDRLDPA